MASVDLTPGELDLTFVRGDDFTLVLSFVDQVTSEAVVLSDSDWQAQIRRLPNDSTAVGTFNVDTSQTASGKLTLSLTHDATASLGPSSRWDLQGAFSIDGDVRTVLAGDVIA